MLLTHSHFLVLKFCQRIHAGIDYHLDAQNSSSRTFTVVFQSKQANSSEQVILLSDDHIFEGTEYFRLRIVAAQFNGQAEALFRAQDGLNNTIADINIADNDCEFRQPASTICLQMKSL